MARQNLLIVDADARTRRVLEVSLRKAGYSITAAESMQQALQFLDLADPELIVSDTRLPDGSGFEFCRLVKNHARWGQIPFIFLTSATELEDKVHGLELGVDDYLTRPIYVKEIMVRVKMLLQRKQQERIGKKDTRTKFSGQLADMAIVDLMQTIEISRKSGTIEFETDLGPATVWFRDGRLVDAQMGRLQADAAVFRLLGLSDGRFEVEFKSISRVPTIEDSTQSLLMEGMRRIDEWGRLLEGLPPLDHVLTVDTRMAMKSTGELTPTQVAILRRFHTRRTIIQAIDDSGLDDLEALENISELYFKGMLIEPHESTLDDRSQETPVEGNLELWDLHKATSMAIQIPESLVTSPPREAELDLPPLPNYPQPFPGAAGLDHDDVLVGGIPDESHGGAGDLPDGPAVSHHPDRVTDRLGPFTIASPMGAPSAEAVGELVMPRDVPAPRARPSSSVIVRRREASGAVPSTAMPPLDASFSGGSPLLSESDADMGRLTDLVAQTLAMNSGVNPAPMPSPSQISAASFPVAHEEKPPRPRTLWPWGLIAVGTAAAAALLWRGPTAADVPRDRSAVAAQASQTEPVAAAERAPIEPAKTSAPPKVEAQPEPAKAEPVKAEPAKIEAPPVAETPPSPLPTPPPAGETTITPEQQEKLEQAQRHYKNGKAKEAEAALVELVAQAPRHAEAQALLANARLDQGKFAEALPAAKAAVEADPASADAQLALGVIAQELGEVATAIAAYERYLELAPKARYATTVRAQLRTLQRKLPAP